MDQESTHTRRSFYSVVIGGMGSLIAAALAFPAAIYLFVGARSGQRAGFTEAASFADLEIGKPREVTFERVKTDGWRTFQEKAIAWVVRTDAKNAVAYSAQCTHLGCAYHFEEKRLQFVCPCHDSIFAIDGKVLDGPAPRPLDRYHVRVDGGKLLIGNQIEKA